MLLTIIPSCPLYKKHFGAFFILIIRNINFKSLIFIPLFYKMFQSLEQSKKFYNTLISLSWVWTWHKAKFILNG